MRCDPDLHRPCNHLRPLQVTSSPTFDSLINYRVLWFMGKAVCKNNRQQVVLKKSRKFESKSCEDCGRSEGVCVCVCVCVCKRERERMCFTAAFHGKLLSTISEGYIGLIGKCLFLRARLVATAWISPCVFICMAGGWRGFQHTCVAPCVCRGA